MSQLATGIVVDSRYEIVECIGSGAFGNVYKAWQTQFERAVALKILNAEVLKESDGQARFEREAKALSGLHHRNIVGFYGYGVWNGAPYMVMEYLHGASLHSRLRLEKRLKPLVAAEIMKQVCEALAGAHANDLVHRDLKPSNIMLETTPDDRALVKIIDFGLAKLMPGYGQSAQKLTEAGCALGTAHYMSPEQCRGGEIDHRSDIYAAGCILYHCISGEFPFDADSAIEIMYHHINDVPRPLSSFAGGGALIDALQAIVDHATAKNPADRYQNATEMASDLTAVLSGRYKDLAGAGRISRRLFLPLTAFRSAQRNLFLITPLILAVAFGSAVAWNWATRRTPDASAVAPSTVPPLTNAADLVPRIVSIPIPSTPTSDPRHKTLAHILKTRELLLDSKFSDAENELSHATVDGTKYPSLYWDLQECKAEMALARGKYATANNIYNEILTAEPARAARCLIGLTRRALLQHHYDEASQYLASLTPLLSPTLADAYDIRALHLACAAGLRSPQTLSLITSLKQSPIPNHPTSYVIQSLTELATRWALSDNHMTPELKAYDSIIAPPLEKSKLGK